jgi:hypothetical protein
MEQRKILKDLVGQKIGRLTVLERCEDRMYSKNLPVTTWRCKCDCGNIIIATSRKLKNNPVPSCGCYTKERYSSRGENRVHDLTGQRFTRLLVTSRAEDKFSPQGKRYIRWNCVCDCGKPVIVNANSLVQGRTKSCGCYNTEKAGWNFIDLTGRVFGRLTVVDRAEDKVTPSGNKCVMWNCVCECGNKAVVNSRALVTGNSKSCGCYNSDVRRERNRKYNTYNIIDGVVHVFTPSGKEFLMDEKFLYLLNDHCWEINQNGYVGCGNKKEKRREHLHRIVTNCPDDKVIDHINGDPLDNCLSNLRIVTAQQNLMNRKPGRSNTSGVVGVTWIKKSQKWRASIGLDGKTIPLGYYKDFNDAVEARHQGELKYFGDYAYSQSRNTKEQ